MANTTANLNYVFYANVAPLLLMVMDQVVVGYGVCRSTFYRSLLCKCKHFLAFLFCACAVYHNTSKRAEEMALEFTAMSVGGTFTESRSNF